jgi:hypothetical protein
METQMPQTTKDSKSDKNKLATGTDPKGGKRTDKGSADNRSGSPAGSQNHGEKKTTP